jgi:hypothetical protein
MNRSRKSDAVGGMAEDPPCLYVASAPSRRPWSKGLLVGQKKPLRACDLVKLRLDDICSGLRVRQRATIVQKKTGRPVQFEITKQSRNSVEAWLPSLRAAGSRYLFPSRLHASPHISIRQYARLVHRWVESIGLERAVYGTHSMRRTKAAQICREKPELPRRATSPRPCKAGEHRPISWD